MVRHAVVGLVAYLLTAFAAAWAVAGWAVTPRGSVLLAPGSLTGIQELSGVTYLGPAGGGLERFAAVQDENGRVVIVDVAFMADGSISSATAVSDVTLALELDHEGIAFSGAARNTVFVSEENTPGVHEFDLATGDLLQSVAIPTAFDFHRGNRGFESLSRSLDGRTMWTANEEALSIDGPLATSAAGTTVRLQRLADDGANVTAGPQFAYEVDPIHLAASPNRSGLADLVMLPDDTLLALERSAASTLPAFRNRIYQIDFAGATDINTATYDAGLVGTTYTPVAKNAPLWSGQAGVGFLFSGENLEGLTLGPALAGGSWVLVGVIDDGDNLSSNRIVSFELSLTDCSLLGDYNCSGAVDDADYTLWKNTFGSLGVSPADGSGNGVVDAADYTVWRDHLGDSLGSGAAANSSAAVPEPSSIVLLLIGGAVLLRTCRLCARRHAGCLGLWPKRPRPVIL